MKAPFLIFHGFGEAGGISKKTRYQVEASEACGPEVDTCWLDDAHDHKRQMINSHVLRDYDNGIRGKILKRTELNSIVRYVKTNGMQLVYVKSDHNITPSLIRMLRRLKRTGIKAVMEVPTYPYDQEYKGPPWVYRRVLMTDKCLRGLMATQIDKLVTSSDHKAVFGRPTIQISSGTDFDFISLKQSIATTRELYLIAVATIHPQHGFDRAIRGLTYYLRHEHREDAKLHIVGQDVSAVADEYHVLVEEGAIEQNVIFRGPLFGEPLSRVLDQCQIGIGSSGHHRSGTTDLRSSKNREYAARDILFIYSETDVNFESTSYISKIPANESPVDIGQAVRLYHSVKETRPADIRASIRNKLSWEVQMKHVVEEL